MDIKTITEFDYTQLIVPSVIFIKNIHRLEVFESKTDNNIFIIKDGSVIKMSVFELTSNGWRKSE